MKITATTTAVATATTLALLLCSSVDAFGVENRKSSVSTSRSPSSLPHSLKNAAAASFAALTIASNIGAADASTILSATDDFYMQQQQQFPSTLVSEKVTREGVYGTYEVDLVQEYDDARSTFKPAKETKSKKGKYTALLAVLVVGSFIIPMAQYFWYVKDDDSSDKFFAQQNTPTPPPPEPKKKKGWF